MKFRQEDPAAGAATEPGDACCTLVAHDYEGVIRMIDFRRSAFVFSLATMVSLVWAAPAIGVAFSRGTLQIDSASIRGTANISDGASVRTSDMIGQIELSKVEVVLGGNSDAAVYDNRVELRAGAGEVTAKRAYSIDALGFRIAPVNKSAVTRVAFDGTRILVTCKNGPAKVSRDGVLLAKLNPGTTYFFERADSTANAAAAGRTEGGSATGTNGAAGTNGTNGAAGAAGAAVQTGLSTGATWGIASGVATAAVGAALGEVYSASGHTAASR